MAERVRSTRKDYRDGLRQTQSEIQSGNRGKFWKPRQLKSAKDPDEGNRIRIIVPGYIEPDPEYGVVLNPWVKFRQYRVPVGGKTKPTVVPLDFNQPDPIDDFCADLEEGTARDREKARSLGRKSQRFIALVVDLDESPDEVHPWEFGPQVAEQIIKFAMHRSYNLPWDNEEGHDLWVRMWGSGLETEYEIIPEPSASPLPDADKLMRKANLIDLARFVVVETPETLEDMLDGKYDPEEAKERRKARDKATGRPFPLFVEDREEGGEEPKGVRGSLRKSVKDEEEEPKPVKPRRTAKKSQDPEPEQPKLVVGSKVGFDADGESYTGRVVELHLDDDTPYVAVDTEDGEEPWDVNVTELEVLPEVAPRRRRAANEVAPEAESDPEPDAKTRRRRKPTKGGDEPEAEEPAPVRSSIVDRVSQLSRNARGEK